jgi:hypothetical protein
MDENSQCDIPGLINPLKTVVTEDPSRAERMIKPLDESVQYIKWFLRSHVQG